MDKTSGLTIQEAIKSGKPFVRKSWKYIILHVDTNGEILDQEGRLFSLNSFEIVATDWEIRP